MKMDRNTVIGFVLLAGLLFLYLYFSTKSSQELQVQRQKQIDSLENVKKKQDTLSGSKDTVAKIATLDTTGFPLSGEEKKLLVENDVFKISFSNKGGQPREVELKNYTSTDGKPVILNGTSFDNISYPIKTGSNRSDQTGDLYFSPGVVTKNSDGSTTVIFQLTGKSGEVLTHQFLVRKNDYMIDWSIKMDGADKLLSQGALNLNWQSRPMQQEKDAPYERQLTNICFYEDNDFDYIQSKTERKFEAPVKWTSVAQQFFNSTLVAEKEFTSGDVKFIRETEDSSRRIADVVTNLQAKLPLSASAEFPMHLFYGPNEYKILKAEAKVIAPEMDKIVNLGRDFYAFVRPINKYIVMPVFDFINKFIGSYGLVIAFLTIFIRLVTSPLVYTSYLSGAKMKALRPEIEKMKQRLGNDQQAVGMEQMKLFREAGVNPLGGCIPALLQIPIFFALYSFFNSNIALRGVPFLWADDLSSYDVILKFPFHIWGFGSHLSLFTLTAAATSFLISIYNMNMTPDQSNPALKYMPYIFPFILLFIFNRLPSALTWYYTVSNVITLILQWVIQNYIIDHDKILAKLEANRKKPKTKPKWQERFEQMQEAQKKVQAQKGQKK